MRELSSRAHRSGRHALLLWTARSSIAHDSSWTYRPMRSRRSGTSISLTGASRPHLHPPPSNLTQAVMQAPYPHWHHIHHHIHIPHRHISDAARRAAAKKAKGNTLESQAVLNELVHRGILVRTRPISEGVCTLMLCSRMCMLAQPQVCPYPCIPTPSAYAFYCNIACCNALQYYMWMRSVHPPLHARAHSCAQHEDCSATQKTFAAVSKMLKYTGSQPYLPGGQHSLIGQPTLPEPTLLYQKCSSTQQSHDTCLRKCDITRHPNADTTSIHIYTFFFMHGHTGLHSINACMGINMPRTCACLRTRVKILHQRINMDGYVYRNVHRLQGSSKLDHSGKLQGLEEQVMHGVVMAYVVMAYVVVTYAVMAYAGMAYVVMTNVVMANAVMTYDSKRRSCMDGHMHVHACTQCGE